MNKIRIFELGLLHALGVLAYIAAVAVTITQLERVLEVFEHTILLPILFLALFVFSAAMMGLLIFGRPILWFLEGKKADAMSLLAATLIAIPLLMSVLFFTVILGGGEMFGVRN